MITQTRTTLTIAAGTGFSAVARCRDERTTEERLDGYVRAFQQRQHDLNNIALVYRNQARVYPLQIEAILEHLRDIRQCVLGCRGFLQRLAPQETERLQPYGCILKLGRLDYLLTEQLLQVEMHGEVCATFLLERISLHLAVRQAFPAVAATYDDFQAMFAVLVDKASTQGHEEPEEAEHVEEAQIPA